MPFAPHLRLTALGRFGISNERFSYGLNMARTNADATSLEVLLDLGPNRTALEDMANDFRSFHGRLNSGIASHAILEAVKIASIGADGKYTKDPVVIDVVDQPGGVTSGASFAPPQQALAVSLVTAKRGAGGRGRFFLPAACVPIETDMLISTSIVSVIQGSAAQLLSDLNNNPGADLTSLNVVVASTTGTVAKVTGVRVGRALDTIRSRRRSLAESYGVPTAVSS
jgi:hypothetical protein